MRSAQSRNFFTAVIVFLLALLILGIALRALVADYLKESTFRQLENDSAVLSHLAAAYYADGGLSNMQFLINLDVAARVSQTDAVICSPDGRILLCSDSPNGCSHQFLSFSQDYVDRIVDSGGIRDMSQLRKLYDDVRYISARPICDANGQVLGIVVVSAPIESTQQALTSITNYFFTGAVLVLVVCLVIMAYLSRLHNNPLREMTKTASAFGHGDLDARVKISGNYPQEVEELAVAFNNMASSLQKSEYQRQEFVANVSHELKTPMTTISGYVDGMLDGTIPQERHRHYMKLVSEETKRLSRLVRSMLDISVLQSEGSIPEEKMMRFDICEAVGQMLITFEQKILAKGLNVEVDFPEYPAHTIANRDYISQVIYNLLDNAVKFCPEGKTLSLKIQESNGKIFVSVANEGRTIPPEELPLVFDRFHKIDKSRSRNRDGWGLGLYIVKTIVGFHGEDISVTSLDGRTEFTFTLPLVN